MLKRTPLYDLHRELGAKLVPFAGFEMPIQYTSIVEEHRWVRQHAGLFDVSHMGEILIRGPRALEFTSYITSNDPARLAVGQVQYSSMLTEKGTFVDDLLTYRLEDHFLLVVNAANIDKDFAHVQRYLFGTGVEALNLSDETGEVALQGPKAQEVLQPLVDFDLETLGYYWARHGTVAGVKALISRTGYTGEDGFEIYTRPEDLETVARALLDHPEVKPIGLGARDTLRLEMGYPLYGNDIDETINPFEAGLGWIVRMKKPNFVGKEALQRAKAEGLRRKRVGFVTPNRRVIPRHHMKLLHNDQEVGFVSSGNFSPMLDTGIGMGYVPPDLAQEGQTLALEIRKKKEPVTVVSLPFYKQGTVRLGFKGKGT